MIAFGMGVFMLWCFGYLCWLLGSAMQEQEAQRQEQAAELAYRWAVENDRLPTVVQYVDSETGEVIK